MIDTERSCREKSEVWPMYWYRFPLLPWFVYRKEDKYNTTRYGFHWLGLSVWTLDSIAIDISSGIAESIYLSIMFPFIKFHFSIPIMPISFLQKYWRKPKGLKNYFTND